MGSIPTSSAQGAHLKTSIVEGSWRQYSCNRYSRGHRSYTNTPGHREWFYTMSKAGSKVCKGGGQLEADGEGQPKGQWWRDMLMCMQETHNERDRRRGEHEEQGVS